MQFNDDKKLRNVTAVAVDVLDRDVDVSECLEMLEDVQNRLLRLEETDISDVETRETYVKLLSFLLNHLHTKWYRSLSKQQEHELFDSLFLQGFYVEESFLFLVKIVSESSLSYKLDKVLMLLELILKKSSLIGSELFLNQCKVVESDPTKEEIRSDIQKEIISALVSLPERIANIYQQRQIPETFLPVSYFGYVIRGLIICLDGLRLKIIEEIDCSMKFASLLLGRICLSGNSGHVLPLLTNYLSRKTSDDYVWRRLSQTLFVRLPDHCTESVITPLIRNCSWYKVLSRILGNSIVENGKMQFLFTNKFLLMRVFEDNLVLQNIIGYLADDKTRRKIFLKMFVTLVDVWGNSSSLKHRPYVQHVYMTKAVIICCGHLTERDKVQLKDELTKLIMHAVESHLSCASVTTRRLGMFAGETIIKAIDPNGPTLKFEYERNDEIVELEGLLRLPADPEFEQLSEDVTAIDITEESIRDTETKHEEPNAVLRQDEELDSDDDLEPYDMSNDTALKKHSKPRYLRDCMEGLIEQNDPERTQTCLEEAEKLIRDDSIGLTEISIEMTKILLHLENVAAMANFVETRHRALTSLAVHCPKQVPEYLCDEFYDRNYNLRQRMDILEVLVAASQELAQVKRPSPSDKRERQQQTKFESPMPTMENWRDIIQKRIESKTRRFGRGAASRPEPVQVTNRFSAVAGCFFYPLIKRYDHKENTFDLLGSDFFVLGRLVYSLGMILHAAINTPVATHIGQALLEFLWGLRYHVEAYVRQAVIFSICMVLLTVPSHLLIIELHDSIVDWQQWLVDVVSNDSDTECKQLAVKALSTIETTVKQAKTV